MTIIKEKYERQLSLDLVWRIAGDSGANVCI